MTSESPLFSTPSGPIRGCRDGSVLRARGIPYARAERFGRPEALEDRAANDVLEALEPSPASPQAPTPLIDALGDQTGGLPLREDCQHLSVTVPADRHERDAPLPVMVWIHGGGYTSGAGDLPVYDPAVLAHEQRVIVVTVTYRLGVLGYLGDGAGRPANLGLLDQLAALEWVQRNIAGFGGDPARVTAFGQSAGADAILHLMAIDRARGLFSRAIVQSAPMGTMGGRAALTAAMSAASAGLTPTTPVSELARLQADAMRASRGFGRFSLMPFAPQPGHDPLPSESQLTERWLERAAGIPLLIGVTAEETRLFLPVISVLDGLRSFPTLYALVSTALDTAMNAIVYARPARRLARDYRRAGGTVLRYVFRWRANDIYRASHAIEVPFVFGTEAIGAHLPPYEGARADELAAVGRSIRALWGDFAHGRIGNMASVPDVLDLYGDRGGPDAQPTATDTPTHYGDSMTVPDTQWREIAASPFVSLGTYRRNGALVSVPVWIARDGDELVVTSERSTGKVKRLRNDSRVTLQPCSRMGTVEPDAIRVEAEGRIAGPAADDARADAALKRKYGFQYRAILGVEALVRRIQRKPGDRVIIRIARSA
ncbi:PPOX class F420-dependent oxidoreductase [Microbacterium testaceum]|uniref:PPOX class F420-dependent oxidoreductase n=1 Tax=Microbacterium testaceum TaxID=2033 RepID=UPI0025B01486|nr:PPOX class F420-dependent oxidoreductase [Microbacterium testaceum]WJS92426.1 PPOX class F420-dependent oxidoreductase [Microbacterium testaceum]